MSEDKKPKQLTVEEIKAIEPLADVYQFNKFNRYIVMVKRSNLVDPEKARYITSERAKMVYAAFQRLQIPVVVLVGADEFLTIFEVKP